MQTQFGGSVSQGPARLNLKGWTSATAEAAVPPKTAAPLPALAEADNDSTEDVPHWVLALRHGAEQSDATEHDRGGNFQEELVSVAAVTPAKTVKPVHKSVPADMQRTSPPWGTAMSR